MSPAASTQDGAEDDMDMDDDDGPMRIVRNYQRHDARYASAWDDCVDRQLNLDALGAHADCIVQLRTNV